MKKLVQKLVILVVQLVKILMSPKLILLVGKLVMQKVVNFEELLIGILLVLTCVLPVGEQVGRPLVRSCNR